jgi:flagellar protein FlaJ
MNLMEKYQRMWGRLLTYNDIDYDSRRFSFLFFFVSLNAGLIASLLFQYVAALEFALLGGLLSIVAIHAALYTYLLLGANGRAAKVEEVLPDFLALVASNIRAGLTPDRALIVSAREEFGPLTEAVDRAGKHSLTGKPIEQVITGMGEHINSNVLEKTIRLIVEGLQSGGDMPELLEKTALDIRKFRSVRREISSIILNYVLFIVAAITFGAPMLYGVAGFLVDIMLRIKKSIGTGGSTAMASLSSQVGLFKGQLQLTPEAVMIFSGASIVVTVFFGCMAVGVMYSGRRIDGLKYFPMLALLALAILFAVRGSLVAILGGMLGTA